jgi:SAM-dependent methyltransferase
MGATWDARYRESPGPAEPSDLLVSLGHLLPKRGRALDIACGSGRNSIWLAQRGLDVVGVDFAAEALRLGRELATRHGCSVTWLQNDVESFQFEISAYDIIACFNYRSPTLYPGVHRALRPGGWVVFETYTLDQLQFASGPRNPEHLLRPGELLMAFGDLRIAFYREVTEGRALASLVAQKMPSRNW